MARTWRKGFVLFVIILTLLAFFRGVIPSFSLKSVTRTPDTIHTKFTGSLSQNLINFEEPLKQFGMTNWRRKQGINCHDLSRILTTSNSSIEELNRINDMAASIQPRANQNQVKPPNSLTPHSRIIIQSDADFASQGWPGNGTIENPYHIANLNITWWRTCVQISNTRVHFVISDCWMKKRMSLYQFSIGIILTNVTNGFITNTIFNDHDSGVIILASEANDLVNNSCFNIDEGFRVSDSNTISLVNNTCTDTFIGISVLNSTITSLINNTCTDSSRGILVRESNAIMINNNTCSNSYFGLMVFDSSSTEIINNTIRNCYNFGCEIYPVNDNILANNSLVSCGFFFGSWDEMGEAPTIRGVGSIVDAEAQIAGNFVNHRPLILWLGRVGGTVPLGGGQVILLNCSLVTVQNQNLSNASIGIFLCFTDRSWVSNNTCIGHSVNGIRIQNCEDITVNNNLCTNNSRSGITIDQTFETTLTGNTCNYSPWAYGILLTESYDNWLINNTCNYNLYGIFLDSAFGTELYNNTCNHNWEWYWSWVEGSGIWIDGDANTVRWNLCNDNGYGIMIEGSDNSVSENTCTNNWLGIFLRSDTTPIFNNLCVNNGIGIYISGYRDIIINTNTMVGCGLYIDYAGREWIADVDISGNTVNGRPLVFLKDCDNIQVRFKAGQIILFNCQGITVREQILTDCSYGLLVYCTNHSLFVDNSLRNNEEHGIFVRDSHDNRFTRNSFSNNDGYGIYLDWGSQNNIVDWNIFPCNDSHDARDHGLEFQTLGANIFDCNYWSNYSGYDLNFDGFGDIPYNVSGVAHNCDLHPLMTPILVLAKQAVEPVLSLLEGLAILVIVIIVFVLIRTKLRSSSLTSLSNHHSTLT
ncbi:MAG: NosD domain-containing protein [Candidatus Hermodarchaeota archaeon]